MSVPSRNVAYKKPAEPPFLKAFKDKVGYKEPIGIEAKRPVTSKPGLSDDGNEVDRDDELPTVVVLQEGDLGQQEFLEVHRKMKEEKAANIPTVSLRPDATKEDDSRIRFRKPTNRTKSNEGKSGVLDASTSMKSKPEDPDRGGTATVIVGGVTRKRRRSSGGESKSRRIKNNSLLSFGGGGDDEEEN